MAPHGHALHDKYGTGVQRKDSIMENTGPEYVRTLTQEANENTCLSYECVGAVEQEMEGTREEQAGDHLRPSERGRGCRYSLLYIQTDRQTD